MHAEEAPVAGFNVGILNLAYFLADCGPRLEPRTSQVRSRKAGHITARLGPAFVIAHSFEDS